MAALKSAAGRKIELVRTSPRLTFDAGLRRCLLRFLNQTVLPIRLSLDNLDVIISQNGDGCLWPPVPQLLVIHDLIPLYYPNETPRLHRYYKSILPEVIKRAAAIAAVSQHTRKDVVQQYKTRSNKVHVCYNGLSRGPADSLTEKRPPNLPLERYFLFVGTYAPRKNLETVTRALAAVRDQIQESLVIVAYPDKWMPDYLQAVEALGLSDRVVRLAGLSNEELAYMYRHATALFLLSEYEGFGFPALEAMLAGTATVVSDSTAVSEVVGDAALKIKAHDIDAAAKAMIDLSTDQEYRERLRRLGMQRARTFTWARTGDQMNDILSEIVQARGSKARTAELSR